MTNLNFDSQILNHSYLQLYRIQNEFDKSVTINYVRVDFENSVKRMKGYILQGNSGTKMKYIFICTGLHIYTPSILLTFNKLDFHDIYNNQN